MLNSTSGKSFLIKKSSRNLGTRVPLSKVVVYRTRV
jgi:hypothetical protein